MKKIFVSVILALPLFFLLFPASSFAVSFGRVKVEGRQLLTDFDEDGIYEPYFIRGVGYSPFPIGRFPSDWGYFLPEDPRPDNILDDPDILNRDFSLLQQMNANTIRLWKGNDTQDGLRYPVKLTQQTLDLAEQYGIKVIAGFWISTPGPWCNGDHIEYNPPAFLDPSNPGYTAARIAIIEAFRTYVNQFKNHPAILFWAIGNENNYHVPYDNIPPTYLPQWYSLINEMAYWAHLDEGNTYHPIALVNGDIQYIGTHGAYDHQMTSLDIWGANVYRPNASFGDLFVDFASRTAKPLWISEYGVDAYHTTAYRDGPDWFQDGYEGYEDQAAQAQWIGKLWDEMVLNSNVSIGGTVMEYSDEWWKPWEWIEGGAHNDEHNGYGYGPQDTSCPRDGIPDWIPPAPDQFFNEEWFGIMAIGFGAPFTPDVMYPRQVYYSLQKQFQCSMGFDHFYAGPENNKSCDGTSACCNSPDKKSKNSGCVSSCGSGGCFVSGTPILMANNKTKPIEQIKAGDIILAYDIENGKAVKDRVKKTFIHDADSYLIINNELKVTDNHPVFSNGKWVAVGSLKRGDTILNKMGEYQEIKTIQLVKANVKVYNFEVNPYHTYIANGYVVHNRKNLMNAACRGDDCNGP